MGVVWVGVSCGGGWVLKEGGGVSILLFGVFGGAQPSCSGVLVGLVGNRGTCNEGACVGGRACLCLCSPAMCCAGEEMRGHIPTPTTHRHTHPHSTTLSPPIPPTPTPTTTPTPTSLSFAERCTQTRPRLKPCVTPCPRWSSVSQCTGCSTQQASRQVGAAVRGGGRWRWWGTQERGRRPCAGGLRLGMLVAAACTDTGA